jgi:hypothetical protein
MVAVFTVYFEDPFWVGVLETEDEGGLVVARHVFGAEPSNTELLSFMLYDFARMNRSRGGQDGCPSPREAGRNAKRAQREAKREMSRPPSTKAQAALSAAREGAKASRVALSREQREAEAARLFELRSEKRKRKHAGH